MFNKKFCFGLILVFIILFGVISTVSASDLNATGEVVATDGEEAIVETANDDEVINSTEENVLNSNPATFTQLNDDINGNTDKDVYLKTDYKFVTSQDYNLHDGININRPVTIHGNGATIDGSGIAGILKVNSNNVTLMDITFKNGNSDCGGAIWGPCYAVNCNFISNHAGQDGGALYYGAVAENCTFIENVANMCGGAIFNGYAINCNFIGNKAVLNTQSKGGAIYWGYAYGCNFINNSANLSGGAMSYWEFPETEYDNLVSFCTFEGNTAKIGGALYYCDAVCSNFTKNSAEYWGGAMVGGSAYDCFYMDNVAQEDNDTYDTLFANATMTASNFVSKYQSGDILNVNIVDEFGDVVKNGYVTAKVYKNKKFLKNYYFTSGSGWKVNLDAGTYDVILCIEHQSYNVDPVNITVSIEKIATQISASSLTTVYNGGKYLVATLKDEKGNVLKGVKVSVVLNGKTSTPTTDNKGQVKVSTNNIAPNKYPVKITFNGNDNYLKTTKSVTATVKKANVKLTAKNAKLKAKTKTKKYSVTLKDNNGKAMKKVKLTLKIKGKKYTAKTNSKGKATFKITKFTKKGKHATTITFKANKYYNALNKKVKLTVK